MNLFHCLIKVVGHSVKVDTAGIVQNHITGPWVQITGLAHRTHIAHDFLFPGKEDVVKLVRGLELILVGLQLGENAGDMGMSLKAGFGDLLKDDLHFPLVVNIVREDILIGRVPGGTMNKEVGIFPVQFGPNREKIQSILAPTGGFVRLLQLVAGPKNRLFRGGIEAFGVENGGVIVISHENHVEIGNQVHTFSGIGPVTYNIPKAITLGYTLFFYILKNRNKGLEIAMDIAYYCLHKPFPDPEP